MAVKVGHLERCANRGCCLPGKVLDDPITSEDYQLQYQNLEIYVGIQQCGRSNLI